MAAAGVAFDTLSPGLARFPGLTREEAADAGQQYVDFNNETGSPYHTVSACTKMLDAAGFQKLNDAAGWTLAKGGKYYVTKDASDIMAFVVGGEFDASRESGFSMVGAHTDSPCLRLRPNSKMGSSGMLQVGIQTYGGGMWHTWFDRPLGFAGKVVVKGAGGALQERLIHHMEPIMILPNLAIHLQTAEERKAFAINPESHLQPVICSKLFDGEREEAKNGSLARHHAALLEVVAKELGCAMTDIVDADLCFMDANPSNLVGVYKEFVSAPRIDNTVSCWGGCKGICEFATDEAKVAENQDIALFVAFDHEEVGSLSATGADGNTLPKWCERILGACGVSEATRHEVYARSYLVSIDCAHGVHPNYSGKHQAEHRPEFHKGIVIKTNANQRYATTPLTASLFREVADKAGVPIQDFVVRNDSPCGTTIGPIISSMTGVRTIDVGASQWSMHSARETCSSSDCAHLRNLSREFFSRFRDIDIAAAKL